MMTAKLFENGRSQAVRLPKECRFSGEEVAVNKIGDIVILMPKDNKWAGFCLPFTLTGALSARLLNQMIPFQ